jgi:hypothetical protein
MLNSPDFNAVTAITSRIVRPEQPDTIILLFVTCQMLAKVPRHDEVFLAHRLTLSNPSILPCHAEHGCSILRDRP